MMYCKGKLHLQSPEIQHGKAGTIIKLKLLKQNSCFGPLSWQALYNQDNYFTSTRCLNNVYIKECKTEKNNVVTYYIINT